MQVRRTAATTLRRCFSHAEGVRLLLLHDMDDKFQDLYFRTYQRTVRYLIRHWHFSVEEARDLAQDVFVSVFKHMQANDVPLSWTFIKTVAHHRAVNEFRARAVHRKSEATDSLQHVSEELLRDFWGDTVPASPEDAVVRREESQRLDSQIERLPPALRATVLLRLRGLTYEEISQALHISIDATRTRLRNATKLLRAAMYSSSSTSDLLERSDATRIDSPSQIDANRLAETDLTMLESELNAVLAKLQEIRQREVDLLRDVEGYRRDLEDAGDWAYGFHRSME